MTKEKVDLKSPQAIALEIAALGIAAWYYRHRVRTYDEKPGEPKRPNTPLAETVGDGEHPPQVYVMHSPENGEFEIGAEIKGSKFTSLAGKIVVFGEDSREIIIERIADIDFSILEAMREKVRLSHDRWKKFFEDTTNT